MRPSAMPAPGRPTPAGSTAEPAGITQSSEPPISSRKRVPPWAASKRPTRRCTAPVKAPFSCPNSSEAISAGGIAAQFTRIKARVGPVGPLMNRPGHQFFARPGFPHNEHGGIRPGHFLHVRQHLPERGGGPDDVLEHRGASEVVAHLYIDGLIVFIACLLRLVPLPSTVPGLRQHIPWLSQGPWLLRPSHTYLACGGRLLPGSVGRLGSGRTRQALRSSVKLCGVVWRVAL